jgi:hypothetical protein
LMPRRAPPFPMSASTPGVKLSSSSRGSSTEDPGSS